ncbi:TlyA family RNA methyltransferase [Hathewaya histolytica]|uniref:Hemolysin A n=1 Tax=Hathewaya histolytica TaxID=1498 RepID=A0A4U9RD38_HATHI|nr:TlyA family RNA methyltransferase [Hathewaya histolytica]VTQ88213.1 hemolysin A [Hathewaya histolytica]
MENKKERLDVLLIKKGIFKSRERARENILNKKVYVNGKVEIKPGTKVDIESKIEFKGEHLKYVSRGGLKLEKALSKFNITLQNKLCLDIGASTGGFTHCMLLSGAKKIFAIDVGKDQLHESLENNPKVISYEETNVRELKQNHFNELGDFASIDVSFISLKKVMENVIGLLKDTGEIVALIKPQFEAGKRFLNKKGVVKDQNIHKEVVVDLYEYFKLLNFKILGFDYSPVTGPNGNIEYLVHLSKNSENNDTIFIEDIHEKIKEAFNTLK